MGAPRRLLSVASVVTVVAITVVGGAAVAGAHTEVQRATPGPAEVVTGAPDGVEVVFLDPVLPGVRIDVARPDGRAVPGLGGATLHDGNRRATVAFDPLDAGAYVVSIDFVSEDGHPGQEAYRFTVEATPAAAGESGTTPADPTASTTTTVETDELPPAPDIIPEPNAGSAPEDAGDRGGALQAGVLVAIVVAVGLIAFLVVRESRKAKAERDF